MANHPYNHETIMKEEISFWPGNDTDDKSSFCCMLSPICFEQTS